MGIYSDTEDWADIIPIPQDDGGPNPLAAIAYTDEYSEAMSYLRAVMAQEEKSARVLALTEDIIGMNPAHYTVWLYRASVLFFLKSDLLQELAWLDEISLLHLKNYQIWHHRHLIMSRIPTLPPGEPAFLALMLAKDVKNYHVWSYRQWLVRHFSLWDSDLPLIEAFIRDDVRNNSAWNHRWFLVFGRVMDPTKDSIVGITTTTTTTGSSSGLSKPTTLFQKQIDPSTIHREITYAQTAIRLAPQNPSPWNYLRGILTARGTGFTSSSSDNDDNNNNNNNNNNNDLIAFAEEFSNVDREDEVRSTHALDFLAECYAERKEVERARRALEMLAMRFDPVRRNYWNWRMEGLVLEERGEGGGVGVAG